MRKPVPHDHRPFQVLFDGGVRDGHLAWDSDERPPASITAADPYAVRFPSSTENIPITSVTYTVYDLHRQERRCPTPKACPSLTAWVYEYRVR